MNRGLLAPMVANEPFTAAKVAPPGTGAGLPPIDHAWHARHLGEGRRGGRRGRLRRPRHQGRRRHDDQQPAASSVSRVVVSNVQVLAAGTKIDQDQARDGKPVPTTVVTLLVTPEDAEKIALAAVGGPDHADAAQPARRRADADHGHARGDADGRAGAAAASSGRRKAASAPTSSARWPRRHRRRRFTRWKRFVRRSARRRWCDERGKLKRLALSRRRFWRLRPPGSRFYRRRPRRAQAADQPERVLLTAGRSTVLMTEFDITRIAVTNPAVADAVVVKPREVLVDGKGAGTVSLIVWGASRAQALRPGRRPWRHQPAAELPAALPG